MPDPSSAARPGPAALFAAFLRYGVASLIGDPTATIERDVLRRGWVAERTFRAMRILSRIAPGPPPLNLAIIVGRRLGGRRGALAAAAAMLMVPALLAASLGLVASRLGGGGLPPGLATAVQPALSGVAVAGAGLAFAAAAAGLRRIGPTAGTILLPPFMVGVLVVWHWPIALVGLVALPVSAGLAALATRKEAADA